jgi:hypothetical protein
LQAFTTLDHKRGIARVLEGFAWLARRDRVFERALMLAGAAATVRQTFGVAPRPTEQAALERSLEPAWKSRDRAAARALWLAGGRMSLDEAIAYALA